MPYQQAVTTKEQAFCHLLLFFSLYEDETFEGEETYQVFSILKLYPLTAKVNFAEEVNVFFDYKNEIPDIPGYFQYLLQLIGMEFPSLILFNAVQVALSDTVYSEGDNIFLGMLRTALEIDKETGDILLKLALAERNMKIK